MPLLIRTTVKITINKPKAENTESLLRTEKYRSSSWQQKAWYGIQKDKIVVIDDPVSSMDSSSLFIVSALVREMVEVCENNAVGGTPVAKGNYIKQIFILTHNAYFHREITYNRVRNNERVYLLTIPLTF